MHHDVVERAQLEAFFHQQRLTKERRRVEDRLRRERRRFETNQRVMTKAQNPSNDSNFVSKGQEEEREGGAKLDSDDEPYSDGPRVASGVSSSPPPSQRGRRPRMSD